MKTALVVIDMQSYFLKSAPADLSQNIAQHIKESNYDLIAFTVFKNEDDSNWERSLHWSQCKSEKDILIAPKLQEYISGNLFTKVAYSAFKAEGFEKYLKNKSIKKIKFCGIDLEDCVLATAFEAFDKGYEVEVLFDLSFSRDRSEDFVKPIILRDIQTKNESRTNT